VSSPADRDPRMKELDERERYALKKLRESMRSATLTVEGVGEILPDAVVLSSSDGGRLPKSMVETTERAIGLSVTQDPAILSEALFPIIGSAIRKAIERLVSETMFKMNAGLEKGLSPERLAWRIEARRSGVPFYEVVLRHTLDYRVEHVFLIHKGTGLLLADVSQPGPSSMADKDMVASMLTAVRDYIKDSLSLEKEQSVNVLSAGEYSIFVEEGPLALVALVVRGTADPSIRSRAQDALETVHTRLGPELRSFEGEVAPFEEASECLSRCLVSKDQGDDKKKSPVYAIALLCTLTAVGCFFIARGAIRSERDRAFIAALDAEPGIVVVDAHRSGGLLRAKIMRSAQAREIAQIAAERGFDTAGCAFDVERYLSLGPESGTKAGETSPAAIGSQGLGTQTASSKPGGIMQAGGARSAELAVLASRLSALHILFDKDSERPSSGQDAQIAELRGLVGSIVERSRAVGLEARIEVVGHSAGQVRDMAGDSVSVARANKAAQLIIAGDSRLAAYLAPRGASIAEPLADESILGGAVQNRSATFKASFR
jgi:hypothetical protein